MSKAPEWIEHLDFPASGLLPVVVQDRLSGRVLMLAHANREALQETADTGLAHFWSRSRSALWKKGETSGATQRVHEIRIDCDQDAVLYLVEPAGPACHTGETSCFFRAVEGAAATPQGPPPGGRAAILWDLAGVVASRRTADPAESYTARLLEAGIDRILRKVGEEAAETIVAAKNGDPEEIARETADLLYHVLVMLEQRGLGLGPVLDELSRRRE